MLEHPMNLQFSAMLALSLSGNEDKASFYHLSLLVLDGNDYVINNMLEVHFKNNKLFIVCQN